MKRSISILGIAAVAAALVFSIGRAADASGAFPTPTGVTLTATSTTVAARWHAVSGSQGYHYVLRTVSPQTTVSDVHGYKSTSKEFTDLAPATRYELRIAVDATSSTLASHWSQTYTITTAAAGGDKPDGVPPSEVGAERWKYPGAQLSANGFSLGNVAGSDCSPGTNGSYSTDSAGDLILTSSGADNCAEVSSTATYNAGIYEAKIYVTAAWGAYWMSGPNWPANGEIDAMEILGGRASITYHGPDGASPTEYPAAAVPGWHTVDIVRQTGKVSVYWDGKLEETLNESTATAPENILFDVTDGGTFKVAYAASWDGR